MVPHLLRVRFIVTGKCDIPIKKDKNAWKPRDVLCISTYDSLPQPQHHLNWGVTIRYISALNQVITNR